MMATGSLCGGRTWPRWLSTAGQRLLGMTNDEAANLEFLVGLWGDRYKITTKQGAWSATRLGAGNSRPIRAPTCEKLRELVGVITRTGDVRCRGTAEQSADPVRVESSKGSRSRELERSK